MLLRDGTNKKIQFYKNLSKTFFHDDLSKHDCNQKKV